MCESSGVSQLQEAEQRVKSNVAKQQRGREGLLVAVVVVVAVVVGDKAVALAPEVPFAGLHQLGPPSRVRRSSSGHGLDLRSSFDAIHTLSTRSNAALLLEHQAYSFDSYRNRFQEPASRFFEKAYIEDQEDKTSETSFSRYYSGNRYEDRPWRYSIPSGATDFQNPSDSDVSLAPMKESEKHQEQHQEYQDQLGNDVLKYRYQQQFREQLVHPGRIEELRTDYLSLSLSPPLRRKEMPPYREDILSLSSPKEADLFEPNEIKEIADNENKVYCQQEDASEYCPGGYMPVTEGDVLGTKFEVFRKLGFGHFSTVWLCQNIETNDYVAVKISKSSKMFRLVAGDEIKLLECTKLRNPDHEGYTHIVQMFEFFMCESVNGIHTAIAMEIMGPSLLHLIIQSDYQGLQISAVKRIIKQVILGLLYLHEECNIIHTDIKPENILIKVKDSYISQMVNTAKKFNDLGIKMPRSYITADRWLSNEDSSSESDECVSDRYQFQRTQSFPEDAFFAENKCLNKRNKEIKLKGPMWVDPNIEVKIADLGNACWEDHHYCKEIQTKQYRALEVILAAEYSYPADLWSVGCLAFELACGEFLFNPRQYGNYSDTADHLTLIWEVLDGIPEYITVRGEKAHRYFRDGQLKNTNQEFLKIWKIEDVLVDKYEWKRVDAIPFSSFVESLIEPDPALRATASVALQNEWLNDE